LPKIGIVAIDPGGDFVAATLEMLRPDNQADWVSDGVSVDKDTVDENVSES
jgi:hypothetical protein